MTRPARRKDPKGETIASYGIGKGKTDPKTWWKRGCKSPNPKGRPSKAKTGQRQLDYYLDQTIEVPGPNGAIERMTKRELAYLQIANMAAKGNLPAFRVVQEYDARREGGDNEPLLFNPELTKSLLENIDSGAAKAAKRKPGKKQAKSRGAGQSRPAA